MEKQKACGAVVFFKKTGEIKYLLIQHSEGKHWAFPKGRNENKETEKQTAIREIKEETGIEDLKFIDGFREKNRYIVDYGNEVSKTVILFIAKTNTFNIKLSDEHIDFKWCNFKEARDLLTYSDAKKILKKANDFLNKKGKK